MLLSPLSRPWDTNRVPMELRRTGSKKIAIYQSGGLPTHAARQLPDGQWTSKLGRNIDISHTLPGLEGPEYGQVAVFMRRPWA